MLVEDIINEADPKRSQYKTVVVYGGRFQPPHIGHMKAWKWLKQKFGNAYIATSDKVEPPRSPFNFTEKKAMLMHAGVPSNSIVQVKSPYRADEIVQKLDADNTVLLFAISEKDMEEDPRFAFKPKKDGSPGYFQSYKKNINDLQPLSQHAYIVTVPTFEFKVLDEPMKSATEFRANFAQADDSTQAKMIQDLYGNYSDKIHNLMREKIV